MNKELLKDNAELTNDIKRFRGLKNSQRKYLQHHGCRLKVLLPVDPPKNKVMPLTSTTWEKDTTGRVASWSAPSNNCSGSTLQNVVDQAQTTVDGRLLEQLVDLVAETDVLGENSTLVLRGNIAFINETDVSLWLGNTNLREISRDADSEAPSCEPWLEGLDRSELNSSLSFATHSVPLLGASRLQQTTEKLTASAAVLDCSTFSDVFQPDALEILRGVPVSASPHFFVPCDIPTASDSVTFSADLPTDISAMMTLYDVSADDDISLA